MVAEVIQSLGDEQQKQAHLPKLCNGDYRAGAFCLSEASAGSNPAAMSCSAVRDGEGWLLNGRKAFVTSGEYADLLLVWAVTDASVKPGKGISIFLVESGKPGIELGRAEEKMGQRGSATNEIIFDNCRLDGSALLGEENSGYQIAVGELAGGRIGIGSLALGIGLAALDYALAYIGQRRQFGRLISDFQGLQWMLAEAYTDMEAARLLVLQAAWCKQQGRAFAPQASMAKLFATEKANSACYTALQMLGGAGYLKDHPLERWARDVRVTTIYEGTSEIQRIIIARDILQRFSSQD